MSDWCEYTGWMDEKQPRKSPDWDPTPRWLRILFRAVVCLFGVAMLVAAWPVFTLKSGIQCTYQGICAEPSILGPHAIATLWPMLAIGLFCLGMSLRMASGALKNRKVQQS